MATYSYINIEEEEEEDYCGHKMEEEEEDNRNGQLLFTGICRHGQLFSRTAVECKSSVSAVTIT